MSSKTHQRRNVIICVSLSCLMAFIGLFLGIVELFFSSQVFSCFSVVAPDVFLIFSSFMFVSLDFQVLMKKIRSFAVRILQLTLNIR